MGSSLIYLGRGARIPTSHHTIVLGPRHEALLDDTSSANSAFAADMSSTCTADALGSPLAPPGHGGARAGAELAGIDWTKVKRRYRDASDVLRRDCVPGLRDALVTERLFTPADFETSCWVAWRGLQLRAGADAERVLPRPQRLPGHREPVLRRRGTHPGAGLPGVLSSAKVTDSLIPALGRPRRARAGRCARRSLDGGRGGRGADRTPRARSRFTCPDPVDLCRAAR